jgi:predicted HAD superfamily Cof-like phosphohydrolase
VDSKLKNILEFNKAFGLIVNNQPTVIDESEFVLRYKLMQEELNEYRLACVNDDMEEVCDAIVDLLYVLNGIIIAHGVQDIIEDMYLEVHKSNMSKLENGKPLYRHDGKVLKGSEYFKPNLKQFLND